MDLFKKLKDWLSGGTQPAQQSKPATVTPQVQQQQKAISTMPKVLNAQGQQDWLKKNTTVASPTLKVAQPTVFKDVNAERMKQLTVPQVAQPKPVVAEAKPVVAQQTSVTQSKPTTIQPQAASTQPKLVATPKINTAIIQPKPPVFNDNKNLGTAVGLPDINAQWREKAKQYQVNEAVASKKAAEIAATRKENASFIDKHYQGADGNPISGRNLQTTTFKHGDGSAKTYGALIDEFNNGSRLDQDNIIKDLESAMVNNRMDFGDSSTAAKRDEASTVKLLLEERGVRKSANPISFGAGMVRDMATGLVRDTSGFGQAANQTIGALAGHDTQQENTDFLEKQLKSGKISKSDYAKAMNSTFNANEAIVGDGEDRGAVDRALRLVGNLANTVGNVVPIRSLGTGVAKDVIGTGIKNTAKEYAKDFTDNAVMSGLGALQDAGIDAKPNELVGQALTGGVVGIGMRGVGDVVGSGIRAVDRNLPSNYINSTVQANPTLRDQVIDTAGRRVDGASGVEVNPAGEIASSNNANTALQNDAIANTSSTSNHVSTKESSFDSSISENGVTKVAPRTMEERVAAVSKGIITPETKSLPLSDRLATALNHKAAIDARSVNPTEVSRVDARNYNNATDFVNSQLPENTSLFDPRRNELRALWEDTNADIIAAKQSELNLKREQRELRSASANKNLQSNSDLIDTLNPTGGLFVGYNPESRMKSKLADNITTLDKTSGASPDDMVTIYRGAPSSQGNINPGDFVTTNYELAKSYTGDGNVLEAKVPMRHVLDDLNNPLGDEYLYRPEDAAPAANSNVQIARDALEKQQAADLSGYTPEQKAMIKQELDALIYDRNPELMQSNNLDGNQLAEGADNIPRLHVNDLKRYFGHTEDMPTRYKRTTGNEDIDLLAKSAGYDDVDQFVEAIQSELSARSSQREAAQKVIEMRRNIDLLIEARNNLENGKSISGDDFNATWSKTKPESFNKPLKEVEDELNGNEGIARDIASEIDRLTDETKSFKGQLKAVRNTYEFNEKTEYKTARFKQREAAIINAINQNNAKVKSLRSEGGGVAGDIKTSKQAVDEIALAQKEAFIKTEKAKLEAGRKAAKEAFERSENDPRVQKQRKITELERQASEAVERGFNDGPRHTVENITDNVARLGYVPRKRVEVMVQDYASKNGYDISSGRAFKNTTKEVGSLADEAGNIKSVEDIQPSDEIMQRINRPGVKHALPYGTQSPDDMVRQMVYKHEDGTAGAYFEYKTPDGKWQKSGLDSIDIKSPQAGVKLDKLKSDAAVNAEVKRSYETGTTAQYIWRENDAGLNSEFIREFDAAMSDGSTLDKVDSNKIVGFDPDKHYIESGKVVDSATGKILGNYIEITPDGVNMFAGRQRISLSYNDLDLSSLKKMKSSGYTWTTEGIIDRITGSLPTGIKDHIVGVKDHTNDINYFRSGGHKTKESLMHVMVEEPRAAQRRILEEDNALGLAINTWEKDFNKSVKRPKQADARRDAVYVIEPAAKKVKGEKPSTFDERLSVFESNYGKKAAENLKKYDSFMRGVYDNLLVRMNNERTAIGKPEIKRRANYITHIAEMADNGTIGQLMQGVNNIMGGDVGASMRNPLPASIVGTTEAFKPKSKYNPFSRERLADNKPLNPFDPLRVYSSLALQNIHMTKSITMNRSLETSVRALSEAKQEMGSPRGLEYVSELMDETIDKAKNGNATADDYQTLSRKMFGLTRVFKDVEGVDGLQRILRKAQKVDGKINEDDLAILQNSATNVSDQLVDKINDTKTLNRLKTEADNMHQFVGIIQEHANKLAGKSDPVNRWIKEKLDSPVTDFTMKLIRAAQQHSALSSIVGSVSSALNQSLSVPLTMGTTHVKYQLQALNLMHNKALMKKSDALWLRYKESILSKKSKFQKVMDKGGAALAVIEKNCMQWSFAAKYVEALDKGLNDRQAIKYAERFIGDTTSWRDIASAPRVYGNAITSTPLQFAREVTQQNRAVWNRFTPKERVGVMLSTYVVVNALAFITGNKSGSDPLGAIIESGADIAGFNDAGRSDEENSPWKKAIRALQNAGSEVVAANPLLSATANFALSKEERAKVFGEESTLGRYEGNMAMFSGLTNLIKGGANLVAGNPDQAWKDLVKLAPAGGQMQKTASGLQAMMRGYTTTTDGKPKTTIDQSNPGNWAWAVSFGPNALPEQKKTFTNGNNGLSPDQQKVFSTLLKDNGNTEAKGYLKAINGKKDQAIADKKAGVKTSDATFDAETKVKLADGTWKEKDGKIVDKNDKVVTQFYKERASKNQAIESDETYSDFMTGYNLKKDAEVSKTGNSTLDKMKNLDNQKKANDNANTAVSLLSNSNDGYEKIPDWVKDRFYKESGFSKKEVEYAASATYTVDAKVDGYFRPLAEAGDHKKLLDELYAGRVKGINNKYFATTTVIEKLYDEGYLSKDERATLKAADLSKDGKQVESKPGSSKTGGKKGKSGSKKASLGYSSADISKYANGGGLETYSSIAAILKATRQGADNAGSKKISSPSVQTRGLRAIVNSRKQSTKKRRLA